MKKLIIILGFLMIGILSFGQSWVPTNYNVKFNGQGWFTKNTLFSDMARYTDSIGIGIIADSSWILSTGSTMKFQKGTGNNISYIEQGISSKGFIDLWTTNYGISLHEDPLGDGLLNSQQLQFTGNVLALDNISIDDTLKTDVISSYTSGVVNIADDVTMDNALVVNKTATFNGDSTKSLNRFLVRKSNLLTSRFEISFTANTGKTLFNIYTYSGYHLMSIDSVATLRCGSNSINYASTAATFIFTSSDQTFKIINTSASGSTSSKGGTLLLAHDDGAITGSGDLVAQIFAGGAVNTTHTIGTGAIIKSNTTQAWSGSRASDWSFWTVPDGSTTPLESVRFKQDGSITLLRMAPAAKSLLTIDATTGKLDVMAIVGNYGVDAGVSDDYVITITGATWTVGNTYNIFCNTANTGACTVALNGGAAIPIWVFHDNATPPDSYIEADQMISVIYSEEGGAHVEVQTPDSNP